MWLVFFATCLGFSDMCIYAFLNMRKTVAVRAYFLNFAAS